MIILNNCALHYFTLQDFTNFTSELLHGDFFCYVIGYADLFLLLLS